MSVMEVIVLKQIKSRYLLVSLFVLGGIFCMSIEGKGKVNNVRVKESVNNIIQEKKHYIPNGTNGVWYEYYQTKDGRWSVNGKKYNFRLVLDGRMPNAAIDTEFVVLTNDRNLSFHDVNQSIVSSDSNDNLYPEIACVVEMR